MSVNPIPEGYGPVIPYLIVDDPGSLMDFMMAAFGAEEHERVPGPDGRVAHGELKIGGRMIMVGAAREGQPALPAMVHLYVEDCDAVYQRALAAGATSTHEPSNQFYGDRGGGVVDPHGITWWIATHVEDVTPEQMAERQAAMKQQG